MSLYFTLEQLLQPGFRLPALCNVYVGLDGRPIEEADRGGRWHLRVRGLSGRGSAMLAVHKNPRLADLSLSYHDTSPALIELFENRKYSTLFQSGELALVQAVPMRGAQGMLFLNVPHILIIRPFQLFGRRQIDFSSKCARKLYLSVVRGVRRQSSQESESWASVGGYVAHDVFARLAKAAGTHHCDDETVLADALSPRTLLFLGILGLTAPGDLSLALRKGYETLTAVAGSSQIQEVLTEGASAGPEGQVAWTADSPLLNNGVSVAPDLLGSRKLIEFKSVNPEGDHYREDLIRAQAEVYLAWAMVEYGVEEVLQNWVAYVVNTHPRAKSHHVISIRPQAGSIAWRIRNRHRLLALAAGRWLPPPEKNGPDSKCDYCEFGATVVGNSEPLPCEFYCQMERSWDCYLPQERECPLLGHCDQYNNFVDYARTDLFNRLRGVLHDEDEQRVSLSAIVHALQASEMGTETGLAWPGFKVLECRLGKLKLQVPKELDLMDFASPDDRFILLRGDQIIGKLRFRKRRGIACEFAENRAGAIQVTVGEEVALRVTVEQDYTVREQIAYLEQLERLGEEPLYLRPGGARSAPATVHRRPSPTDPSAKAPLLLVDSIGRASVRAAAKQILQRALAEHKQVLLIASQGLGSGELGVSAAEVSDWEIAEQFSMASGKAYDRLRRIADAIAASKVWEISREDLFEGRFDSFMSGVKKFDEVVVLEAETFPLLGMNRCLALSGGRLVLVGQACAAGPPVQSPSARTSLLFQNTLRFLLEAGAMALPETIQEVDVVRVVASRVCQGLGDLLKIGDQVSDESKLTLHQCPALVAPAAETITAPGVLLTAQVPATAGQMQYRELKLRILSSEKVSISHLRAALKGLSARPVESLSLDSKGRLDTSVLGLPALVELLTVHGGPDHPHEVTIGISAGEFPFVQERSMKNEAEARALVDFAATATGPFHAVSPFVAQCRLIARLAAERNLTLRVYPLGQIGKKPLSGDVKLLISTVVGAGNPSYPYPMNDVGRLAPVLAGGYSEYHLFCCDALAKHHPLFRELLAHGGA